MWWHWCYGRSYFGKHKGTRWNWMWFYKITGVQFCWRKMAGKRNRALNLRYFFITDQIREYRSKVPSYRQDDKRFYDETAARWNVWDSQKRDTRWEIKWFSRCPKFDELYKIQSINRSVLEHLGKGYTWNYETRDIFRISRFIYLEKYYGYRDPHVLFYIF